MNSSSTFRPRRSRQSRGDAAICPGPPTLLGRLPGCSADAEIHPTGTAPWSMVCSTPRRTGGDLPAPRSQEVVKCAQASRDRGFTLSRSSRFLATLVAPCARRFARDVCVVQPAVPGCSACAEIRPSQCVECRERGALRTRGNLPDLSRQIAGINRFAPRTRRFTFVATERSALLMDASIFRGFAKSIASHAVAAETAVKPVPVLQMRGAGAVSLSMKWKEKP